MFISHVAYCMRDIAEAQSWTQQSLKQPQIVIIKENPVQPWTGISSFSWHLQGMYLQNSTKPLLRSCKMWFSKAHSLLKLGCFRVLGKYTNTDHAFKHTHILCSPKWSQNFPKEAISFCFVLFPFPTPMMGKKTNIFSHPENVLKQINWKSRNYSGSARPLM